MIDIVEYIPIGHENGVTVGDLESRTNLNNREVRLAIAKARENTIIINLQDGSGYFRPGDSDYDIVERWMNQEKSRRRAISHNIQAARDYLGL